MSRLVIRGGLVVDPGSAFEGRADLAIEHGRIAARGQVVPRSGDQVIEAGAWVVTPGLIDMHVHLREPGDDQAETIASGSAAAVTSGFATIVCMPNTKPPIDNEAAAEFVTLQAKRAGKANIFPVGAITKGRAGQELSEMGQLAWGGAVGFSDDGAPVMDSDMMRRAMIYARMFGRPILSHAEDLTLSKNGVMHRGRTSLKLGLPGIPSAAEEIMVARDIALARMTGGHLHILHVSTARAVEYIRAAKKEGLAVTAETAPHYFTLTDEAVESFDTNLRVNPPVRTREDVAAIKAGLADGTIDVIASDHAPHAEEDKDVEFLYAPAGIAGIETMVPLVLTHLVESRVLSLPAAIAKMTTGPARVLGLPKGSLVEGGEADVTILDLQREWTVDRALFIGKSRNNPFQGWKMKGAVVATLVGGRVFWAGAVPPGNLAGKEYGPQRG